MACYDYGCADLGCADYGYVAPIGPIAYNAGDVAAADTFNAISESQHAADNIAVNGSVNAGFAAPYYDTFSAPIVDNTFAAGSWAYDSFGSEFAYEAYGAYGAYGAYDNCGSCNPCDAWY